MDKGRQIDKIQNVNARWVDQFNHTNKTSVRTTNPPGGKSTFSLGWSEPEILSQKQQNNRFENIENNANWGNFSNMNSDKSNNLKINNNPHEFVIFK